MATFVLRLQVDGLHRRINLRRGKPGVAEHLLDQPHVGPAAQHVRGEGVADDVAGQGRGRIHRPHIPFHHPAHRRGLDPPPARLDEKRRLPPRRRAGGGRPAPRRHGPPRAHHERAHLPQIADEELLGRSDERNRPAFAALPVTDRQRSLG